MQALEKADSEGTLTLTLYVGYVATVAIVQLIKLLLVLSSCVVRVRLAVLPLLCGTVHAVQRRLHRCGGRRRRL